MWFLMFYDPLTLLVLVLAYIVGFSVLFLVAGVIAPRVARKFASKFALQTSMAIIGLLVIVTGLSGIGLILYVLLSIFEFEVAVGLILTVILIVLVLNLFTYLISPFAINLMYGARKDAELQRIVNEVAMKLGFKKPPKAVVVEGPPNAFAYGSIVAGRYVAVTRGMLEIATPEELRAVIGHELGHHRHRDNAVMLFMGLIPSVLYFLGIMLIRTGLILTYARHYYRNSRRGEGGGLLLAAVGFIAVVLSFLIQVLVLAFSRLREYYADSAGAHATSPRSMQRALARIHLFYNARPRALEPVRTSKLRALFIYAFTEAYANPFYRHYDYGGVRSADIDRVVDELRKAKHEDISEFFSTHPPIPKRIKFLDTLAFYSKY
ncbi:MAG: zinc metalloprotease HtpX [Desulfurococcaceae archaeon]